MNTYGEPAEILERFAIWLSEDGKSVTTIAKYVHYLCVVSSQLERDVRELVNGEEQFERTLHEIDERVSGTPGSLKTYKTALRAYRDFVIEEANYSHVRLAPLFDPDNKEKKWCQEFDVATRENLSTFISFLNQANGAEEHKWVFRGQGYSPWGLETSLGRIAYKDEIFQRVGVKLKQHENDSLWEFYREASKDLEFRDFKELNLLALMQHYGCKTRLLDFSLSPLVALYMALDQNTMDTSKAKGYAKAYREFTGGNEVLFVEDIPMSLWAVDLTVLNANGCRWKAFVRNSFQRGCKIIRNKSNCHKAGITVVFPEMCNRRVSAQDGLFLMPNNLDWNFEENLRAGLGSGTQFYARENLPSIMELRQRLHSGIIKFVISPDLRENIEQTLVDANVSAKTVYPDLVGLGKYVGDMIHI